MKRAEGRVYRNGPSAKGTSVCGACGVESLEEMGDARHVCYYDEATQKWVASTAGEARARREELDAKANQAARGA